MLKSVASLALLSAASAKEFGAWNYDGLRHGDAIEGEYLVKLKDNQNKRAAADFIQELVFVTDANLHLKTKDERIFGLRGVTSEALEKLQTHPDVEMITPNQVVSLQGSEPIVDNSIGACNVEAVDSWGLARVTAGRDWSPDNSRYAHDDANCGQGVQLHVLDTGVEFGHDDFADLRDTASGDFTLEGDFDGHGHGTHVASTAAGKEYGFARCAQVVSLKVLASSGAGNLFSIIGAMEIGQEEAEKGNRVVVNMSLGALVNPILNDVATAVADSGVLLVAAAGNDNGNAAFASPASAPGVFTVGASAIDDTRSVFSNWGEVLNVFAPGTDIKAACPIETNEFPIPVGECGQIAGRPGQDCRRGSDGRQHCYAIISGTSMACPHAAGVAATYWSHPDHVRKTNFEMQRVLEGEALVNQLTGDIGQGSPNLLLQGLCNLR